MASQSAPVVVGYDGSPASQTALQWATTEAARLHAPLRIVEAFEVVFTRPSPGKVIPLAALRTARESGLNVLADGIRLRHPDLTVQTLPVESGAAEALVEETERAELLVLGSRGLGGWTGLMIGSVAVQVTTHAHCPVVVIPPDLRPRAHEVPTVVVGVDGSKASAKAIEFAFDQAEALQAQVVAVHAWTSPVRTYEEDGHSILQFDGEHVQGSSRLLVAESVAGAASDHPDVHWETRLVNGPAARAILRTAESADLVVVGSRGRGGFTGLLLGSVSQGVLHHAHCPTAIVR
ncbi:nucleotide-binding universal stress UspA family protein [Kribbella orskensis]|uniref:Nucleotide-binding universal stress UspA family protein n=1 Tax=Kribbella orskensis TaxID=2512216 RepID=A0ABY2B8J3_9ACTN|nr:MULTISPECIES: universal stress protein [Kribbella]TCN31170.1 nucleotide-binding universal stress UspA family protein [Kribbella sp. VKM Ac-2500]TCO11676.1 nucleotide-binding universal stress UspA family protein [Kribbella orskensis]